MPRPVPLRHPARPIRTLLLVLQLLIAWPLHADGSDGSVAAKRCAAKRYAPLFDRIDGDLRHWAPPLPGISSQLMDAALQSHTANRPGKKAIGVLFEGGTPYLLSNLSNVAKLGHHTGLLTAHLLLFQAMGRLFGSSLPDVEFIVGTFDMPEVRLDRLKKGQLPAPILRFCSSAFHADIPVPDIHFQMRRFNESLLAQVHTINATYPWASKQEVVFGRFSGYKRIIPFDLPNMTRRGAEGKDICRRADHDLLFCDVRVHFMEWAARMRKEGTAIDVARQPRVSMSAHAGYKYLLHLDGQTCSSRLEQLLLLGSLVLKEESGYHAFFHHLLQPHKHYLPVWRRAPEDVLEALSWARLHDDKAKGMARRAQQVASTFLDSQALTCYWYTLLVRLSALLRYQPGRAHRNYKYIQPVADYLASDGQQWIEQHKLSTMDLP